jgi:hypothetical protein
LSLLYQIDPSRLNELADEIDDDDLADDDDEDDEGESSSSSSSSSSSNSDSESDSDSDGDDEDDDILERLDEGEDDEGDLWRATEAHEREAAKNVEVDMSHVELTDDKKQQ